MMYGGYGMFAGIFCLLIIIIVAYFIIKYFSKNNNSSNTFSKKDSAIDLLNERYAKGEIDEQEYNKRKKILED